MDARKTRKRLSLALTIALLAPGMALAQTATGHADKERELEARVAQLEAQVQALVAAQQQQQAQLSDARTQLDHVQVAIPEGGEDAARDFWVGLVGLAETPKPLALADRRSLAMALPRATS